MSTPSIRHALVCGASRGIGRAAALALAADGVRVTALARDAARLATLVPQLLAAGGPDPGFVVADLDDRDRLRLVLADVLARRGPVHIWVNNTGGPPGGPLADAAPEAIEAAIGRHLVAGQIILQHLLPGMRHQGWGRIVNVLSTSVREPIPNLGVSNLTRAAVASWAKTLSGELPPGVTINNVLPGFTDTDRLRELARARAAREGTTEEAVYAGFAAASPEGRIGRPEELGAVIAFLCSDAASFVRGTTLPVDGGRLKGI